MHNKYLDIVDNYIKHDDLSRHNSNLIYSLPALNSLLYGAISKDYWLERVYGDEIKQLHDEGWIYIHNLDVLGPYCSGYSGNDIAMKGLNATSKSSVVTQPPKHLHSFLGQCSNFISKLSQEIHGACAINDITTVATAFYFIEKEILGLTVDYDYVCNAWQHFIFETNEAFRAGNSAFSNITMSIGGPASGLKDELIVFSGGVLTNGRSISASGKTVVLDRDYKYSDIPVEYYDMINKAFIEVFRNGDGAGSPLTLAA